MPPFSIEEKLQALLDRRRSQSLLRSLTTAPPGAPDFSSNDFLSLSTNKTLHQDFRDALARAGDDFRLGSGGSRLLDGNSTFAETLERDLAAFHNAPAGLLFNSGFDANAGFFACVPQPGDVVVYDAYIHASVHDGMKLSRASKCIPFEHNSTSSLRSIIETCINSNVHFREGTSNIFVAVEGIYSMDGDLPPLQEIVDLVESLLPHKNGLIIIDEAHSTGVLGPNGRGLVCELGLENRLFARLHTFGKAIACSGAIMLTSPTVRSYLINYARPLIYTTSLSHPSLLAIRVSYTFLTHGHANPLLTHLHSLITLLHTLLHSLAAKYTSPSPSSSTAPASFPLSIPATPPRSPIFSLQTPAPRSLAKHCQEHGLVVRPVVPPTVPPGTERIRVCLHAGNSAAEVRRLVGVIEEWVVQRGDGMVDKLPRYPARAVL